LLDLKVGKNRYKLYAIHGKSNATTAAGRINAVEKLAKFIDADAYFHAHMHNLDHSSRMYYYVKNGKLYEGEKHFVVTGSYLRWSGSYAEQGGMPPGKPGSPKIKLYANKRDIRVSI
jgi:hypothetical protein